jgi:peroxiredoxin
MRTLTSALSFASAVVMAVSLAACATVPKSSVVLGQPMMPAAFALSDGGELRLEETRGDVVLLVFFTTWCPATRNTLRALEEIRARNAANGLTVIAVGEGESAAEVSNFAINLGVRARVAFDAGGIVASQLGLPTVPAVIIIARDGTVRHVHAGYHGEEDRNAIAREVTTLLEATMPLDPAERPEQLAKQ